MVNFEDVNLAERIFIAPEEMIRMFVTMLVDRDAYNLCINEEIPTRLQLPFVEKRMAYTADYRRLKLEVVGPVFVKFKNRNTSCFAMVLLSNSKSLLGAIL